jgi:hypothetical protein
MALNDVELLIDGDHIHKNDIDTARIHIADLLKGETLAADREVSFSDVVAGLVKDHLPHPNAAAYLIRFLAVDNLIPKPDTSNRIAQHVVAICERALPDLCQHLGLDKPKQNYEKLNLLRSTHRRVCGILDPLAILPADVELLVSNKHAILQALNQGLVKTYCAPFCIAYVRSGFENVLTKFAKLIESTANYAVDLADCRETIVAQESYCKGTNNFLTKGYFNSFLLAADQALEKFSEAARGRFSTTLSHRLPENLTLQKRYPLHEGRDIRIAVPLCNHGPGMGLAVRASIETDSGEVVFAGGEIALGNVPPGNFSAVFDALVIAPCTSFSCLVTVSWGETGSLARKDLIFEARILPQKDNIDWTRLERQRPYNTDVAKGEAFVGRSEKILGLANKLLRTPMESVYVTGQKRVGKTSLALAAADFAKAQDSSG